jgi:hypothetical protein
MHSDWKDVDARSRDSFIGRRRIVWLVEFERFIFEMIRFFEAIASVSVVLLVLRCELGFNIMLTIGVVEAAEIKFGFRIEGVGSSFTKDGIEFPVSLKGCAEFGQIVTYLCENHCECVKGVAT